MGDGFGFTFAVLAIGYLLRVDWRLRQLEKHAIETGNAEWMKRLAGSTGETSVIRFVVGLAAACLLLSIGFNVYDLVQSVS